MEQKSPHKNQNQKGSVGNADVSFGVSFKQNAGRQNANAGAVFCVAHRWLRRYIGSTRTCDQHHAVHAKDSNLPYPRKVMLVLTTTVLSSYVPFYVRVGLFVVMNDGPHRQHPLESPSNSRGLAS